MSSILSPADMASSASSTSSSSARDNCSKIIPCLPGTPARWFFPIERLNAKNPTLRSGVDLEKELSYRQQAACFIHDMGTRLQLDHCVVNVAIVYTHRFYVFHSFKRFQRNDLAAAALFLAAKVEETPRKLEHIVKIAYALQHRDEPPLDIMSDKYVEEAQKIATFENILIQTLGFDLSVEVPNTFVVKRIHTLNTPRSLNIAAYYFTTDSLHLTTFCLRYRPSVVACACMFLACDWAKWEIPPTPNGKPWYVQLDPEVTPELLKAMADELVSVFQQCPERIRNKRHLATIKRDSNGVVIPSSVMVERNNGISLADLHNNFPSLRSATSHTLPPIALPTASSKVDSKTNSEKFLKLEAVDVGKFPSAGSASVATAIKLPVTAAKKPRPETSKVDFKAYKERMKERQVENSVGGYDGSQMAAVRKSFMPDMSSIGNDSWLFAAGAKDEGSGDPKNIVAKGTMTQSSGAHQKSSSKDQHHERRDDHHHRSTTDRHGHHHFSNHHREEKRKSERSSSAEVVIPLPKRHHHSRESSDHHDALVDKPDRKSTTSQRPRSHASHHEHPNSPKDGSARKSSQGRPSSGMDSHSSRSADRPDSVSGTPAKKRPHDSQKVENGISVSPPEKRPRIIDYEHGTRGSADYCRRPTPIIDYEYGRRIVTDYGHGSATFVTHCGSAGSNDSGYGETKASNNTMSGSSSSPSTVFNGSSSHSMEGKAVDTNGKPRSSSQQERDGRSDSKHKDSRAQEHRPSVVKLEKVKCPQAAALDRHFQSVGMHLSHGFSAIVRSTQAESSNGYSTSGKADISSIVGKRLPDDDVLRRATQKAEQMQKSGQSEKLERLEKLKNTNFAEIPLLSAKKPPSAASIGDARMKTDDPP